MDYWVRNNIKKIVKVLILVDSSTTIIIGKTIFRYNGKRTPLHIKRNDTISTLVQKIKFKAKEIVIL